MATSSSPPRRAFLATAATIGIFSLLVGQVQFAGYDSSLLIDAGWRIAQGQHPYTDFISTLPPSFALLAGAAFRVFGLHWMALNAAATLIYWLLFALGLSLAPRREDSRLGTPLLALYLAALSLPLLVTSHLWHSTLAAQLDTALLFTLLQLYRQLERDGTVARRAMAGASLLAGAVLLSKPNTAAVCLLASAIFPLLSRRPRQAFTAWLTILLTGSLLATALLALSGQSPLTVLASYRGISGRPEPLVMLLGGPPTAGTPRDWSLVSTFSTEAILLLLAGAALLRLNKRTYLLRSPAFAAALAGSAVTLCGLVTNWDLKFNDLAPGFFGLGALLLACEDEAIQGKKRHWFLPIVAALTLAIALALSLGRVRMQMEGPWASPIAGTFQLRRDPFFGPFLGSTELWQALDQADRICSETPPGSRTFFGPRLEFLYARCRLPSPRGLPIWLHPGSSYPVAREPEIVAHWDAQRFDTLVFPHAPSIDDYIRVPQGILTLIRTRYMLVSQPTDPLDVYRLR